MNLGQERFLPCITNVIAIKLLLDIWGVYSIERANFGQLVGSIYPQTTAVMLIYSAFRYSLPRTTVCLRVDNHPILPQPRKWTMSHRMYPYISGPNWQMYHPPS